MNTWTPAFQQRTTTAGLHITCLSCGDDAVRRTATLVSAWKAAHTCPEPIKALQAAGTVTA